MFRIFLTPASISYLTVFLLTVIITLYLYQRTLSGTLQGNGLQHKFLVSFFSCITLLSLLFFLETSFLPSARLIAVYLENTVLALALVFLIQFAYHFPVFNPRQKWEAVIALIISCAYALYEAQFAIWRFSLLAKGQVEYRWDKADYILVAVLLWAPVVFIRQAVQHRDNKASRVFAFIFLIPVALGVINALRTFYVTSFDFYHISLSIGILFTVFIFVANYLGALPESTSFQAKLSGATLTSLFAVLGVVAWMVAPAYASQYQPRLIDHRTLRFTPNAVGGYDVVESPFQFDAELGENLGITDIKIGGPKSVDFDFTFFGQRVDKIYIGDDGVLGIGQNIEIPDLQYHFGTSPAIFPLMIDLYPEISQGGGVFARQEADRLTITWSNLPAFFHPEVVFTFQVVLQRNGVFEITYNGAPADLEFSPNDRPEAIVWMLGMTKGGSGKDYETVDFSTLPLQGGSMGLVQDEFMAARRYLHDYLTPLALLIIGAGLAFLFGFPFFIHASLVRPLRALLRGVQEMNLGNRGIQVPVAYNDEIGFLTQSFNAMSIELDSLVKGLERRVTQRTFELTTANEQLRKLSIAIEQSPSGIVITDLEARVEYVNPAFTQVTGFTLEEIRGQDLRILKSSLTPPEIFEQMWQTLQSGQVWRGEFVNRTKAGENYWEHNVVAPIYDQGGKITHYVAVKEDVTERKKLDEILQQAKEAAEVANRAKSAFLANMSHELRTPLNAILGFTELLGHGPNLTDEQNHNLAIINRSGEHLLSLINDILELSKIESGHVDVEQRSFDLYYLLQGLEEMFRLRAGQKGLSLRFQRQPDVPRYVQTDHGKLRQVLINLLGNAVKFTQQGGITLSVALVKPHQGSENDAVPGVLRLLFSVEDTGIGIANEDLERIFNPFVQAESSRDSHQGTGLGLAICKQYVEMMGGQITVSSELGVGSAFAFDIPAALGAETPQTEIQPARQRVVGVEPGQPVFRVLIVDDVATSRWLLVKLLQPLGFDLRESVNGKEALEILSGWPAHLVFMDIRMPVMDGYEATYRIRENAAWKDIVIVALTSSAFAEERQAILDMGCNEFVHKPFRQEQLFDVLHKYLGIRFVYQEFAPVSLIPGESRCAEGFDAVALPDGWKARMQRAANDGDFLCIQDLIREIEQEFPGIAQELYLAVYNFDYSRLRSIIEVGPADT